MRVIREGHLYEVENMEQTREPNQIIQFIEKEEREGEFVTVKNGTTNEEVIKMMIDRIETLDAKAPCKENEYIISMLEQSLYWLEYRTRDRKRRKVEGTPNE